MRFKGILLDIDDTLYDYKKAHNAALDAAIGAVSIRCGLDPATLRGHFIRARDEVHAILKGTASSHNRLLYFQGMLELAGVNAMGHALEAYDAYWDTFLDSISLYPDAAWFLERIEGRPACFVTDLTAHIQYRKVRRLGLERYVGFIASSEEAGRDKPDPAPFLLALKKLGLSPQDACMVGDSYENDALGASSVGIRPFWLDREGSAKEVAGDVVRVKTLLEVVDQI